MEFTAKTIEALQYFKGKTCTIITRPINRQFDETRSREHFVVDIRDINRECVWGTHPYNGTVSFFPMNQIISIQEEVVLDPVNNPAHRKMIEEYEKETGKKVVSDVSPHLAPTVTAPPKPVVKEETPPPEGEAFVDIKRLTQLARQTKEGYDSKKKL
jgi:hypothetical protein